MKVGFDLSAILYGRGVSHYTSNLFLALAKLPDLELFGYASAGRGQGTLRTQLQKLAAQLDDPAKEIFWHNLTLQKIPPKLNHLLWHYFKLNSLRSHLPDLDVFHSWDYLQPPDKNLPLVSTIHDLAILKDPHLAHPEILRHHQESWRILRQRHAHLIAVSQQTQTDIIKLLHFDPSHVHLVYEALPTDNLIEEKELKNQDISVIRQKFNLSLPYFLFVGTREPRKNLTRLIRAWQPLANQTALVLVGAHGWEEPTLAHPNLHILPPVSDFDLALLYHFALALTYPSLDEGFGLPILEAFYYHTPVLTSQNTATAEVAGNAAILIDPFNQDKITRGLQQLQQLNSKEKTNLITAGATQLRQFSWQKAARQTLAVYQLAAQEKTAHA